MTGGAGIGTGTISSSGGNLSDDASCTPYFTEPTDQHNLGNLASTLGSLSDNGGHIPTIALLEGSPAIDAGVVAPGLAVDARLAVRPQGAAYDSGAYESPFSRAANDSNQTNLAQTGGSQILLVVTGGILLLVSVFYLIIARRATV